MIRNGRQEIVKSIEGQIADADLVGGTDDLPKTRGNGDGWANRRQSCHARLAGGQTVRLPPSIPRTASDSIVRTFSSSVSDSVGTPRNRRGNDTYRSPPGGTGSSRYNLVSDPNAPINLDRRSTLNPARFSAR